MIIVIALFGLSACGGGASTNASPNVMPNAPAPAGSASPGSAQSRGVATTLTFTISQGTAISASVSTRSAMSVSPETETIYVALQNSAGNGNSTFSYTLAVNATSCSSLSGNDNCSYTIQLPIGNDLVSILTASASSVPLDYAGSVPFTVIANGPNLLRVVLSPILAKAVPTYGFQQFNGSSASFPLVSATAYDATGDPIATSGTFPDGSPYSSIEVVQTVGLFETIAALNSGQGSYSVVAGPITPGNSTAYPLAQHGGYVLELGTGTTNWFTTNVTLSTPLVQFTQTEFPQLPSAGVTVPASSNSLTLTCQFLWNPTTSGGLTSNPCPGTASGTISVQ